MENNSVQKTDSDMRAQQHLNNLKDIVMRQTDYSEEQALEKLKEYNKDVMTIVREFMGVSTKTTKDIKNNNTSVNQQIYGEIRNLMDTAAASYKAKKEAEERYEQRRQIYIAQARKELERRKALAATADSSNIIVVDVNTTADVTTAADVTTTDVVNL
jgi:hypothetical protein